SLDAKDSNLVEPISSTDPTRREDYFRKVLKVKADDFSNFNLSLQLLEQIERGIKERVIQKGVRKLSSPLSDEERGLLLKRFSEDSYDTIRAFTQSLGQHSYN